VVDDRYEVIIIGTGAGGGTLAHRLATTSRRVLLLERGGWLPRERANWDSTAVFVGGRPCAWAITSPRGSADAHQGGTGETAS